MVAYNFYKSQGYNDSRILSHLAGIDFTKNVKIIDLTNGDIKAQWKIPAIGQGDYYAEVNNNNTVSPYCLGINDQQQDKNGRISNRIEHKYELQIEITVLKSVAASVLDTWSVKSNPVQTQGGCKQYFNAKDKSQFKQISL